MPRFILDEKDTRTVFDLDKEEISVGRAVENDIAVMDARASRRHCAIQRHNDQYVLLDLGSQNGTRLNGHLVDRAGLRDGDEIRLGGARVYFGTAPPPDSARGSDTLVPEFATPSARASRDRLERMQRVVMALNSELHLDPLLRIILDHLVEISGAERGFLVLREGGQRPQVRVARNFEQEDVASPEIAFSASIVERVIETGLTILTANAVEDERFREALSVHAIRARSVMALPFKVRGRILGAVYMDNRLQRGAFDEDARDILNSLVDLAATAIERAALYDTLERRAIELGAHNKDLSVRVDEQARELDEVRDRLRSAGQAEGVYPRLIGRSKSMQAVLRLLDKVVATDEPVLITGESGTGKELIAQAIHAHGRRAKTAFLSENCAALTETLLESELFGHVRGSFTGADRDKKGLFELADKGTLFLDEVADMSPDMQKKLLRAVQEGEVRPVGGKSVRKVDVRILSASNKRLERLVRAGEFREDLYYRLKVLTIDMPPLRARKEDIPLLVDHFLKVFVPRGVRPPQLGSGVLEALMAWHWPGNVRELENEVKRMIALGGETITRDVLSEPLRRHARARVGGEDVQNLLELVERVEREEIERALQVAEGNKTRAADLLGISRFTLQRKLEKYEMM